MPCSEVWSNGRKRFNGSCGSIAQEVVYHDMNTVMSADMLRLLNYNIPHWLYPREFLQIKVLGLSTHRQLIVRWKPTSLTTMIAHVGRNVSLIRKAIKWSKESQAYVASAPNLRSTGSHIPWTIVVCLLLFKLVVLCRLVCPLIANDCDSF